MSISTGSGDKGITYLADSNKVNKDDPRVKAFGEVDELNSQLGVIISGPCTATTTKILERVQSELFIIGSDLSTSLSEGQKRIIPEQVDAITAGVHAIERELEPLNSFIIPGGCETAAHLHKARTICRRTERSVVELSRKDRINPEILRYLNRLSDMLFLLARLENKIKGVGDKKAIF